MAESTAKLTIKSFSFRIIVVWFYEVVFHYIIQKNKLEFFFLVVFILIDLKVYKLILI